jgi:hypothetical protein
MKKQIGATIKAHLIRCAFYLLLLLAVCAIPFALAQRNKPKASRQNTRSQEAIGPSLPLKYPAGKTAQEKFAPVRIAPQGLPGPVNFQYFENPAPVPRSLLPSVNVLINNNDGYNCGAPPYGFTQSETSVVSFGNIIVVGFNDSGSYAGGNSNHFTGWSRTTDGGATWTDGGTLPASANGDLGDPVLARDSSSGTIYFGTLTFPPNDNVIQVFRSTDNGATFLPPVNGAPGKSGMQDKDWITVDNFSGSGNGNVYLVEADFVIPNNPGIYLFRSTDGGATFGPSGGTFIVSPGQGAFVTVSPDHSVNAYWWDTTGIRVRKSTDQGVTFGSTVTVTTFVASGGLNGDLGLTGTLNGGGTFAFRSNRFPHVAVNPVSGNIYCAYNDKVTAADPDKSNIYFVQSTDGGATWSARTEVNDDSTTTDQWFPNVVVSPAGDRIGIFYYSRQDNTSNNNLFKYYGRTGVISGSTITFSPSSAVSDTQSFPEFGRDALVQSTYMGDYDQAYARAGTFDVVWSDNRSDLPGCPPINDPNVYYQSITVGTGSPTPTATPTASPTPTPTPTATPCVSGIIVNDGFETSTFPPWIVDNANPAPFVASGGIGYPVHSGNYSAHVGSLPGGETPGDSSFYQTITVPAGGGTLSYWYWPRTVDSIAFDWQAAYVTDTSGNILTTIMLVCENTQVWTNVMFDMAPYAGMTVRIKFLAHGDDAGDPTDMFVDDVQFLVTPCPSPTPTATASPTPSATFTPTPTPTCAAGQYMITTGTDTIVPGTTDIGSHCDDCMTSISLPFPFTLYGNSYDSVNLDSNGNAQFVTNTTEYISTCLPWAGHDFTIFPFWADLGTMQVSSGTGCSTFPGGDCGIFTSTTGTAPNRQFHIEFRVTMLTAGDNHYHYELRLFEGSSTFEIIYGTMFAAANGSQMQVAGVQGNSGSGFYTQDFCLVSTGIPPQNVSRTYTLQQCGTRATPTPRSRPTPRVRPIPPLHLTPVPSPTSPRPTPPPRP